MAFKLHFHSLVHISFSFSESLSLKKQSLKYFKISYCISCWCLTLDIVQFPHPFSVGKKSFLFIILFLTVRIVYGTFILLLTHYSVLLDS